jgi:hypothetical protein
MGDPMGLRRTVCLRALGSVATCHSIKRRACAAPSFAPRVGKQSGCDLLRQPVQSKHQMTSASAGSPSPPNQRL